MKKILFIFGSGISKQVNLPDANQLTLRILSFVDYKDKEILNNLPMQVFRPILYKLFIDKIVSYIEEYRKAVFLKKVGVNYEEIYDYIYLIHQSLKKYTYFSSLYAIIIELRLIYDRVNEEHGGKFKSFEDEIQKLMFYFSEQIHKNLSVETKPLTLPLVNDLLLSQHTLNFATLNHDSLLESFLKNKEIEFTDGFEYDKESYLKDGTKVYVWNPIVQFQNSEKINIIKLHGSTDWYLVGNAGEDGVIRQTLIVKILFNNHLSYRDIFVSGKNRFIFEPPVFLTGGLSKLNNYNSSNYVDLFNRLYNLMNDSTHLIVSGYSFGDSAINDRINYYLIQNLQKKLIIITPKYQDIIDNAVGYIDARLREWRNNPRVLIIERKFEEVNYLDIKEFLES